ncbi:hypothetical protein ScPMuIL_006465 [Solemya velum]
MSACHFEFEAGSSPTAPAPHLAEREICEEGATTPSESENGDVYSQLAEKEKDLTLAAELGKALLEQNQELQSQNEQLVEEYTQKLEELEQEKYELHLRFEKMQSEYECVIKELQYDIVQLRHDFQEQEQSSQAGQREKSQAVDDIVCQNERLCEEIRQASLREEKLMNEVQSLRCQVTTRRSSMHEHINQLETLQEEINILTERKMELDRHIAKITKEREALACNLEESQECIAELERQKFEHEQQIHIQGRELEELQETNSQLQAQLELVSDRHHHSGCSNRSNSLYSELSHMESTSRSSDQSQSLFNEMSAASECAMSTDSSNQQAPALYGDCSQNNLADITDDDIECDDNEFMSGACATSSMLTDSQFLSEFEKFSAQDEENQEFKQDMLCVYKQMQQLCRELGKTSHIFSSVDDSHRLSGLQSQNMKSLLQDTRALMQDMITAKQMQEDEDLITSLSTNSSEVDVLQEQIRELHSELWQSYDKCDTVKGELRKRDDTLKKKMSELTELTTKLRLQQEDLELLQAERDRLQDSAIGQLTKDQVLQEARDERTQAVKRRNDLEVQLAISKEEVNSLNSQLLEAVQQKVALSTQLDQWQEDMEELLGIQLKKRIQQESDKELAVEKLKQQLIKKSKSTSFLSLKRH